MSYLPLPTLSHRLALSKRDERRWIVPVVVGCVLLLFYVQPRRPQFPSLSLSRSSSSSPPFSSAQLVDLSLLSSSDSITPSSLAEHLLPRLEQLAASTILDYDESLKIESRRCPTTHYQSNRDQLGGEGKDYWPSVSVKELAAGRSRMIERVRGTFEVRNGRGYLAEDKLEEMLGREERGLVFTAGNKDTMTRLLTSLRILRNRHGCTLPVEIFGFPDELNSLGEVREQIEALGGIEWRKIETEKVPGAWKQFQIKGEAIARSSFSSLLYLDSDNIALSDPTFLFDSPLFKQHGVVLWPDYNRDAAANPIWRTLNTPCDPNHWQAETGQLLINKRARGGMNLVALEVARAMQADSQFWFHLSGGDKDTFRFAFYALSMPYSLAPHYPSALGGTLPRSTDYKGHRFCGHTMLQYGLSPSEWEAHLPLLDVGFDIPSHAPPLFAHANVLKHSGYNNRRGDTFRELKRPKDDRLTLPSTDPAFSLAHAPLFTIRQTGLPVRGICVDLWDGRGRARERAEDAEVGDYEDGGVEVLDWTTAFGGLGRDLEEMYYSEGGVGGAW